MPKYEYVTYVTEQVWGEIEADNFEQAEEKVNALVDAEYSGDDVSVEFDVFDEPVEETE